jgi:uncharacterized protein involved in response to NO
VSTTITSVSAKESSTPSLNLSDQPGSRMLRAWIVTGLLYMLLPGTFLGVMNLLSISSSHGGAQLPSSWVQAHGHAQLFGWVGSFILGIGFYSLPRTALPRMTRAWIAWGLWTGGVLLRWVANIYLWHWRIALPLSAVMELAAWIISFSAARRHRSARPPIEGVRPGWMIAVMTGSFLFGATLFTNLIGTVRCAVTGVDPAFPHVFDQRFLILAGWGFIASFVWGFSARWLPIFLGLATPGDGWLFAALASVGLAIVFAASGTIKFASVLLLDASIFIALALHIFEGAADPAKIGGAHRSLAMFVRAAYVWLFVAALLGLWASRSDLNGGIWGASRHALTVGFITTMVFGIGQRILPHFAGAKSLYSQKLMFTSLITLTIGCALRVAAEPLAYEGIASAVWRVLPWSAVVELLAVTFFASNLLLTFVFAQPTRLLSPRQG